MIGSDPVGRCSRFSGLAMAIRFGFGERSISYACFSVLSAHNWFPFGDLVGRQRRSHMHFTWCTCTRVQMQNLKVLSETLLDNYRITIDMKKECTRVLLGLASPLPLRHGINEMKAQINSPPNRLLPTVPCLCSCANSYPQILSN